MKTILKSTLSTALLLISTSAISNDINFVSVDEVVEFNDNFDITLNSFLDHELYANGATFVNTRVAINIINKSVASSFVAKPLEAEDIVVLKEQLKRKSDAYILLKDNGFSVDNGFATGSFSENSFTGEVTNEIAVQ